MTVTGSAPVRIDIPLCVGANLISYPTATAAPLPDALASIAGKYERIYAYDASDTADPWKTFAPNAAPAANDLIALNSGKGYWLHMTEAAVLGLNAQANASEGVSAAIDIAGWQ